MGDAVLHRVGPLKQSNKRHKTGRHRSKGAIDNEMKGKVLSKNTSHKHKQEMRKEQRRNQFNQMRKNKRLEALAIKRQLGGEKASPYLVCILPMHERIDPLSALAILEKCDTDAIVQRTPTGVTYINIVRFKERFAFIIPPVGRGNEVSVLDYLKVSDTTLLLTSAAMGEDEVFDKWGHRIFNMISAQGIPTPIVALMDLASINPKKRLTSKAAVQKFVSKVLPEEKVMQLDTNAEGLNVIRRIAGQKKTIIPNKANRPHLFGDHVQFIPNSNGEMNDGCLKVTGFLRGTPLDVNGLVHVPGLGDFQMSHIESVRDPYAFDRSEVDINSTEGVVLAVVDKNKQTSLQNENIPDLNNEQTWPTEEDMEISCNEPKKLRHVKHIPKGWNDYQAAWIPDVETLEIGDVEDNDDSMENDIADEAYFETNNFISPKNKPVDEDCEMNDSENEEFFDATSQSDIEVSDEKYDHQMNLQEEEETLKKIKESRLDEKWPDEIDTPQDVPARYRFQKFRGLESFRTSQWDPKENLPSDYARIYQFQNFGRTKRRIITEAKDVNGILPGLYINIYICDVPQSKWLAFKSAQCTDNIIVYGLLPHEHKMSVMNVVLKRIPDSEVPIKSKETLIIQCGYRRFVVNPIFSQHSNGDKHKFERFFRPQETVCATFYAPIQFPPAPLLAFKVNPDSSLALVARGHVLSCNPDRIILKRIVLSGHPTRINRKSATIRYMFFNKEDVEYFKLVKLRTKCGRLGHIKESLGTHGHMKCYFDGQLRSYDTVFMYLYKRVYPKWTYEECLIRGADHENQTV